MGKRCLALAALLAASVFCEAAREKPAGRSALYHKGTELYARGRLPEALSVFQELLRRDPENKPARAAADRIAAELATAERRPPPAATSEASWLDSASEAVDDFLLVDVPRWVNFDDTLGDAQEDLGTQEARRGRVEQLLRERKVTLDRGRPFRKEQELRALLRRLPSATA